MIKSVNISFDALWLMAFMWALFIIEWALPFDLHGLSLLPRQFNSLPSILTFHFLHNGVWHIVANSLPFVILGALIHLHGRLVYWRVTAIITLISGLGTWLTASSGYVAGASGLVFGYWAFLLSAAYFERSLKALAIAVLVFIFYGAIIFGLLDLRTRIAWSAHFRGLVGGIVAGYWMFSSQSNKGFAGS